MKYLFLLFLLVSQIVFAQQKQMSLEDAVYGRYNYLNPKSLKGLAWQNDEIFTFVDNRKLWAESAKSGEKELLLDEKKISEIIEEQVNDFPVYSWLNEDELLLQLINKYFVIDVHKKRIQYKIELPAKAENSVFNWKKRFVTYTIDDNLFISFANGKSRQITKDGGKGIVNGKTVHRNEFGISKGIFVSPNANNIAFYRKDETMVEDYPLVDFMARQAEHNPVKYPMAGMKSHHVKLGIYNIKTGVTLFLKTGEPFDKYLTNVVWSPDEKSIYIAELNREQNHLKMNCYDVVSGEKEKILFEEKSDTYVEPLHPILFSETNEDEFYYLSRKDGWFHIYKYNLDGRLINQVTKGEWEITKILGFDLKEKNIFIEGTKESSLEKHIYKIAVKTGEMQKMSIEAGIHSGILSKEGSYVIDTWNAKEIANKTDLISANGKERRNLFEAVNPLDEYVLGENKLVTLKTADGKTDLYVRLIKPVNFDPNKKYPVVVYVYGGPHSQLVNKGFQNNARWWQYFMASKGFIAFTLDNRGTNNRGQKFETAIHRQLGILETEDQMQGIKYLKSLSYVDDERIGVHGWSYGGFMTLNLMLRHPETFKVGVAGGPVVDWSMYEIMYGERYMDMPHENPEGYEKNNMTNHVSNLNGKLMLIHGAQDKTVVMQHSFKFIRECVKQNKQVDFFAYPIHPHNVRGQDRIHLMEKVSRYFIENL